MTLLTFRKRLKTLNRIEIFSQNILHNVHCLQKNIGQKDIFPVLKANAYGHGISEMVQILPRDSFPYLVVDGYQEAQEIWKVQKRQVLVMGPTVASNLSYYRWKYMALGVSNLEILRALTDIKHNVTIHLFVNTGMNREGISAHQISDVLSLLKNNAHISLEGIFSHFADADGETDDSWKRQEAVFSKYIDIFQEEKFFPKYIHLGNSAGCGKTKDERINSCRTGIALYGYNTLPVSDSLFLSFQDLRPALRCISTITNIQHVSAGDTVSYSGKYTAPEDMDIGILPVGYYEGVNRRLSSIGYVQHQGNTLPFTGNICMNFSCFGAEKNSLRIGDEVIVISEHPEDKNSVQYIANLTETIPYTVLAGIEQSTRRKVV